MGPGVPVVRESDLFGCGCDIDDTPSGEKGMSSSLIIRREGREENGMVRECLRGCDGGGESYDGMDSPIF